MDLLHETSQWSGCDVILRTGRHLPSTDIHVCRARDTIVDREHFIDVISKFVKCGAGGTKNCQGDVKVNVKFHNFPTNKRRGERLVACVGNVTSNLTSDMLATPTVT